MNNFKRSSFICASCGAVFSASADEYRLDNDGLAADCPDCGHSAPEAWWMENLRAGRGRQTGPVTEAGKQRCSRNAVKHGAWSSSYLYPRKPGDYPECDHCQELNECDNDRSGYCHRKAEVFNKFMLAVRSGDPDKIKDMVANNFASMQQLLAHLFKDVFTRGSTIEAPIIVKNSEGESEIFPDAVELKANPAVSRIIDLMVRVGMTLPEFGITPKGQKDREQLQGHLDASAEERRSANEYKKQSIDAMNNLGKIIEQSRELRKSDPRSKRIIEDMNEEKETDDGADES